jgi:hypothetical protein
LAGYVCGRRQQPSGQPHIGTAVRPAKTCPASWDAFADIDAFQPYIASTSFITHLLPSRPLQHRRPRWRGTGTAPDGHPARSVLRCRRLRPCGWQGPASPQSAQPVELRDAAEPIQGDKAAGHLAVKVGHGSPFGFLGCATMPAPSITPGRVIWPWTITATFSTPSSAMVARALR